MMDRWSMGSPLWWHARKLLIIIPRAYQTSNIKPIIFGKCLNAANRCKDLNHMQLYSALSLLGGCERRAGGG